MSDIAVATIVVSAASPTVPVTPSQATVAEGSTIQFSATGPVTWSVQEGDAGGTIDASGLYRAPLVPGTFHVVATAVVVPPALGTITATGGATQSATVGTAFAPLQAKVLDSAGAPVSGATVTFAAPTTGPGGSFSGATTVDSTTDATGTAAAVLTAGSTAGAFGVTATCPAANGSASFALTATAVPSTETPGFTNVTPLKIRNLAAVPPVDLLDPRINGNFGVNIVSAHPGKASDVYASIDHQGVFKSIDYGRNFDGPVNTGRNASVIGLGCGSLTVAAAGPSDVPILYANNLRGSKLGIWRSPNGGVDWDPCSPTPTSQDVYPPVVDPNDANHLVVTYHEKNLMCESLDGGATWRDVPLNPGMFMNGGSGGVWFVLSSDPTMTRRTWLWQAQGSGGNQGIWRTTDSGATWVQVQTFEKPHGSASPWQKGNGEIVYGGPYGSTNFQGGGRDKNTWGTFRSTDYGQTWTRVDSAQNGWFLATATKLYSMFSWSAGVLEPVNPNCRVAPLPGTSGWAPLATPPAAGNWQTNPPETGMTNGWAAAVVFFTGSNWVIVGAHKNGGLWRYVEAA